MILISHLLLGAAIASHVRNPALAVVLAFLSHYFLDFLPHSEYPIKNIIDKNWKKSLPDFLKVFVDFLAGIAIIFIFSKRIPVIFISAFFSIIPDGLIMLNLILKNKFLILHKKFHQKIHYADNKKISEVWRVLIQATVIAVSIFLLFL